MPSNTPMMRALAAAIRANVPVLLMGPPGVGKTAVLESLGRAWGRHVETVVGSNREATDYLGIPVEIDGEVRYAPLGWASRLAKADAGLLFLDELTTAAPSVQKAMLRVLQERYVGDLSLPGTVSIVAAANPADIAVDGWELPAPTANRMMHLDWHFDTMSWLEGVVTGFESQPMPAMDDLSVKATAADKARVNSTVTAFLSTRMDLVSKCPTDPTLQAKAWPSPRSWTNAMAVLAHIETGDDDAMLLALKGCVGEGAAREYLAWHAVAGLYDPIEVMADPSIVDWGKARPDQLFALASSVVAMAVVEAIPSAWEKALAVLVAGAQNGRPDVVTPGARTLLGRIPPRVKGVPAAAKAAFVDQWVRTGSWTAAA